ncbi:hypothetical protein J6590_030140 [Homalodisca vitripennis]|nr:hypothetical protein J6590_030140 [Homalodisca vitripennis]
MSIDIFSRYFNSRGQFAFESIIRTDTYTDTQKSHRLRYGSASKEIGKLKSPVNWLNSDTIMIMCGEHYCYHRG